MHKKSLLILMTAVAVAAAAPAVATATTFVPDLPSDVDQAYIADADGNPENGYIPMGGYLSLNSSTGLVISCATSTNMWFYDDGTTWIPYFDTFQCNTNVPGCYATIEQHLGSWGDRLGYDTFSSSYKDYINVSIDVTLHAPGCPVSGTFNETGVLSPTITVSGGYAYLTFSGSSSGSVSGPIGSATFSGTIFGSTGSGTQLIPY